MWSKRTTKTWSYLQWCVSFNYSFPFFYVFVGYFRRSYISLSCWLFNCPYSFIIRRPLSEMNVQIIFQRVIAMTLHGSKNPRGTHPTVLTLSNSKSPIPVRQGTSSSGTPSQSVWTTTAGLDKHLPVTVCKTLLRIHAYLKVNSAVAYSNPTHQHRQFVNRSGRISLKNDQNH